MTVYSPHGKPILPEFEKLFEAVHPDVDIRWLDMGSQDVLDRVRSERANPQGDVWWGAPATNFIQAADEGLLSPYRPTWADVLLPEFRDDEDRWYGTAQLIPVIAFNSLELTKETAPGDWDELLDPQVAGPDRDPLPAGVRHDADGLLGDDLAYVPGLPVARSRL